MEFDEILHTEEYLNRMISRLGQEGAAEALGITRRTLYRWKDKSLTEAEMAAKFAFNLAPVPEPEKAISVLREGIEDMDETDFKVDLVKRKVFAIGVEGRQTGRDYRTVNHALELFVKILKEGF